MKKLLLNLDKIGISLFTVILINFVFLICEYDFFNISKLKTFDFGMLILIFSGLLLVFKSAMFKGLALLLSILCLNFAVNEFGSVYFLKMLPHFIANKSITLTQLAYFIIFPFVIFFYSLFAIIKLLVIKFLSKSSLK